MKIQTTAAALAIALTAAFAAPAEARVAHHHKTSHASSGAMVKTGAKKTSKAKHKKAAKKGHKKSA
jgi:hypothetical protein